MMERESTKTTDAASQGKSVLVVEDEPSAREAIARYLKRCGHEVATAADSASAMQVAAQHDPDVLVCDWQLGGAPDGVSVARKLTQNNQLVIIFATAYPADELRAATEDLDVAHFFRKPISLPDLAQVIAKAR